MRALTIEQRSNLNQACDLLIYNRSGFIISVPFDKASPNSSSSEEEYTEKLRQSQTGSPSGSPDL